VSAASGRLIDDERRQGDALPDMRHLAVELAGLLGREVTPPLLDSGQAAEILNVPKSWIAAEARAGRIPHVRLGRYVRFNRDELMRWCEGRSVGPRPRRGGGT
jgi:excisionase family DNA binding protein